MSSSPAGGAGRDAMRPARRFASTPRRLAAFGIDYLAILLYIALLVLVATATGAAADEGWRQAWTHPLIGQLLGALVLTLPVVVYFAAFEASRFGGTLGKLLLRVRVETLEGTRLPPTRAFMRSIVKFLPWEMAHAALRLIPGWPVDVEGIPPGPLAVLVLVWVLVAVYLVMSRADARGQTPYDRLAGAVVVARRPSPVA